MQTIITYHLTTLVADLHLEHVEPLAQALGDVFYADGGRPRYDDAEMMRDAIRRQGVGQNP